MSIDSKFKSFTYLENGDVVYSQFATIKSSKVLDAGSYNVDYIGYPKNKVILTVDSSFETSKTHNFPDKQKLEYLFESFFNDEVKNKIQGLGFCHKVGVLLYGQEGTGKSTIMKHYYSRAIREHDAIVFHMVAKRIFIEECWQFIRSVRNVQDNPIIIIFDEFDEKVTDNEGLIKTMIDGQGSINNSIFFAATNYIDKIPKAMKDRPSRFKYTIDVKGIDDDNDILEVITPMLEGIVSDEDILVLLNDLRGQTLDYIKQFCFDKIMAIKHYEKTRTGKLKIGY